MPDTLDAGNRHPDRGEPGLTVSTEQENASVEEQPGARDEHQDDGVAVRRILWGITAMVFLIAAVILLIRREYGYAGVTFAVAVSAAINIK